ncbi:hypothetical protein NM688_g2267 [Phlebia brevispora]|uniref:Uncharacterized protein n=1 Tax=Phlebia brevispora TaxID=194682 RepID=A0ACC1T8W2_9APHY|nr:hypothetical protein NM688_g2267 [Phlebia brevispora]
MPPLPVEILGYILELIASRRPRKYNWADIGLYSKEEREGKDALLVCSTLSRSWRTLVLPYLFHTVAMYFDPRLECSAGFPPSRLYRSLRDFLAFMDSAPVIRHIVQELRLAFGCQNALAKPKGSLACDTVSLVKILHRLPRLRVLELQDVSLNCAEVSALADIGPPLSLDRLYYGMRPGTGSDAHCDELFPLLHAFSEVRELHLDGFNLVQRGETPPPPYLKVKDLTLLSLGGIENLVPMLLSTPTVLCGSMHRLALCYIEHEDLNPLRGLLGAVAPHLSCLGLCLSKVINNQKYSGREHALFVISEGSRNYILADSLDLLSDLARCESLERITFEVALVPLRSPINDRACAALAHIFSLVRDCPIRRIILRLRVYGESRALAKMSSAVIPTREVEAILLQISSLKDLTVLLLPRPSDADNAYLFETAIVSLFPTMAQKKMLRR